MWPPNVVETTASLLDARETYIAHQGNCVSRGAKGLAAALFWRYPEANAYACAQARTPGTFVVLAIAGEKRYVATLYGQHAPGTARPPETPARRLEWFAAALDALCVHAEEREFCVGAPATIALPHGVGCGLAGGDWRAYANAIAAVADAHRGVRIVIYKHG